MPHSPLKSDVHVDIPLTNMSVAYIQEQKAFIADKIFPTIPVQKQSNRYFIYKKGDWFRDDMKKRAPGSESAGGGYTIDNTPTYFCDVWALHKDIDDQTRSNYDVPLDADRDAVKYLTQKALLRKEKYFVENYLKASTWGSDFTPSTLWTATGSDPILDIEAQKDVVLGRTGFRPNCLVVTRDVHSVIKAHAKVIDRFKYTSSRVPTPEILAQLFEVDQYLILDGVQNTANEGATDALSLLKTKSCLLAYVTSAPGIMQATAGYTFSWVGYYGAGASGNRISKFRMEWLKSDRTEIEMTFDMKAVGLDLGVFGAAVIA